LVQLEFALTDAYRDKKVVGNADTPCVRAPAKLLPNQRFGYGSRYFIFLGG
jgi:hypothetical protein